MEAFIYNEKPFPYYTIGKWEALSENLRVGFSTRNGGLSEGYYSSMNLALHVGDDVEKVVSNRRRLAAALGFPFEAWTSADQVHGNNIEIVTLDQKGKGRESLHDSIQKTDGIVTNIPGILLTSYYADCVPLYFFDPTNNVIGLAHAGWRGTMLHIGSKMIDTMKQNFNSKVENIMVAIGPAIDKCCYEVDENVIKPLTSSLSLIPKEAIFDKRNGHFDLDLKKINQQILIEAGILPENIEMSSLCTGCNTNIFFSHRKEKGQTGRMASWIGIRKDD